jgi:rod shape-determining protein MreD
MSPLLRGLGFIVSLLVALMLTLIVLPAWLAPLRPLWLPVVLVFWSLEAPEMPSLFLAFILGLACDALFSSALGTHALAFMLLVFLADRLRASLALAPWWQTALALAPLWALFSAVMLGFDHLQHHPSNALMRWTAAATSVVVWPLVAALLRPMATGERDE